MTARATGWRATAPPINNSVQEFLTLCPLLAPLCAAPNDIGVGRRRFLFREKVELGRLGDEVSGTCGVSPIDGRVLRTAARIDNRARSRSSARFQLTWLNADFNRAISIYTKPSTIGVARA